MSPSLGRKEIKRKMLKKERKKNKKGREEKGRNSCMVNGPDNFAPKQQDKISYNANPIMQSLFSLENK